jgi:hypothetical protein
MPILRLLSVDGRGRHRGDLARLVGAIDADVIVVHDAPRFGRWRAASAAVARLSGRVVVDAGGRRSGGNLLLSTLGVDVLGTDELVLEPGERFDPPGAALALLRVHGERLAVAGARVTPGAASRQLAQLERALAGLAPDAPPSVSAVAGGPDGRFRTDPRLRLDAVERVGEGAGELAVVTW